MDHSTTARPFPNAGAAEPTGAPRRWSLSVPESAIDRHQSVRTATRVRSWIAGFDADALKERYGRRFHDYLLVENAALNLDNTAWYTERLCARLDLAGRILHVGCGFGVNPLVVAECSRPGAEVYGVDPDAEKIEVFQRLVGDLGAGNVHPAVGCGEALSHESRTFDVVVCNECISHVGSIPAVLSEMHRVLRSGGRVVISDTAAWNPYAMWFKYGRGHFDENYQSKRRMARYLTQAGFEGIQRVPGLVVPRNPWRERADRLWWLNRIIDPKYVLVGVKS